MIGGWRYVTTHCVTCIVNYVGKNRGILVHLIFNNGFDWHRPSVCGGLEDEDTLTDNPEEVSCFECERNTEAMDLALSLLPPGMRKKVRRRW